MVCVPVILLAGRIHYMQHPHRSYLRPLRRRWGFTQEELAFLIGVKSRAAVSRIEGSKRKPSVDMVFICALVFNMSPLQLFPGLMSELNDSVLQRANELYEELQGDPSKTTRIKLDFLEQLFDRSETKHNDTSV
jgi:transcriptional regulator with XRE-family HTH domain